nr:MFS transporter [Caldalkalibacillus mannanilyticus]
MAMIGAANGLGLVFGPAIGGALAVLGLLFPLYLSILLPFIAFFIIAFIVPPQKSVSRETVPRLHLWHKRARPYLLIGFITVSSIITLQVNAGFYLQDTLKLTVEGTARILSVALTLSGLALVGTQVLQMKVLNWQPNKLILLGIPISILSLLLLLVTSSLSIYYVAFFIFGIGVGLIMPGFMSGASLAVSAEQQGAVAGLIAAVQGIAAIISPIVSTMLYEVNHSSPFWFLMSLFLFIFILWVPLTRTKKPVLQKEIS